MQVAFGAGQDRARSLMACAAVLPTAVLVFQWGERGLSAPFIPITWAPGRAWWGWAELGADVWAGQQGRLSREPYCTG